MFTQTKRQLVILLGSPLSKTLCPSLLHHSATSYRDILQLVRLVNDLEYDKPLIRNIQTLPPRQHQHSLSGSLHSRPRAQQLQNPVVLFISGVASDALNWQAVVRLLSPVLRSYTYDRSDYHNSESSPLAPSAENVALELSLLIEKAPIPNPLILVAHSWAGVLMHEYKLRSLLWIYP